MTLHSMQIILDTEEIIGTTKVALIVPDPPPLQLYTLALWLSVYFRTLCTLQFNKWWSDSSDHGLAEHRELVWGSIKFGVILFPYWVNSYYD